MSKITQYWICAVAGVAITRSVHAQACAPAATLSGDPALVEAIGEALRARGISDLPSPACPVVAAIVSWRGDELVVAIEPDTERVVREVETAASVIESFVRIDVTQPLLAIRPRSLVTPQIAEAPTAPPSTTHRHGPRYSIAVCLESARGNDGTTWAGAHVKAGLKAGPVWASAQFRKNVVVRGLSNGGLARDLNELLIGLDIPVALGGVSLTPGVAAGLGSISTRQSGMERESGGFSAEARLGLTVPMARGFALETGISAGLGVPTDFDRSMLEGVPADPWGLARIHVGVSYRGAP